MSFFGRSGYMSRCGRLGFVALSLGIGLYVAGTARAVVIDDFTAGAQSATANFQSLDLSQSGLPTANVIGGTRGVELWGNTGVTSFQIDTTGEGKAIFDVTSGNGYLTLTYGSAEQPLNLDLAALGHDAIQIRYRLTNANPLRFGYAWYRVYGSGNQIALPINNTAGPDIIQMLSPIPASNDLTDIDRIALEIGRVPAGTTLEILDLTTVATLPGDLNLDGFVGIEDLNTVLGNWNASTPATPPTASTNIPEPTACVVLLLSAGACVGRGRRGATL